MYLHIYIIYTYVPNMFIHTLDATGVVLTRTMYKPHALRDVC